MATKKVKPSNDDTMVPIMKIEPMDAQLEELSSMVPYIVHEMASAAINDGHGVVVFQRGKYWSVQVEIPEPR